MKKIIYCVVVLCISSSAFAFWGGSSSSSEPTNYGRASQKMKINQTLKSIMSVVTETRMKFMTENDYSGLGNSNNGGIAGDIMQSVGARSSFGDMELASSDNEGGDSSTFYVKITDVPEYSCRFLMSSNMGDSGTGFVGFSINGNEYELPVGVSDAGGICKENANAGTVPNMTWVFK